MFRKTAFSAAALLAMAGANPAFATNGMNLEGYGAKSHAMGGASMAFDTGNSAVMNNPATLGYMKEGTSEIGVGIRGLHPDIDLAYGPYKDSSSATAFYMPSLSYMRKDGAITWGAAVLSQGGMGAEYGPGSSVFGYGKSMNGVSSAALSGLTNRSEVGVGRVMFPLAWQVSKETNIGITADFVWASMDLQMDIDGDHFRRFTQNNGGSLGGTMYTALAGMLGPGTGKIYDINYTRVDFSNGSPWIGQAVGYGTGVKIGFTQKLGNSVTVGGSYHSRTAMSDLETTRASMTFGGSMDDGSKAFTQTVTGKVKVKDFEWPATWAFGAAVTPNDRWLLAADVKWIDWSSVMDKFSMEFTADNTSANGGYAGKVLDMTMTQDWKDQAVWSFGAQYKATKKLALRGGASFSTNPVSNRYLNPLFPAIIENHYTCGFGYQLNDASTVAAAFSWAPKVTEINGDNLAVSHSQTNWSLNFTHKL